MMLFALLTRVRSWFRVQEPATPVCPPTKPKSRYVVTKDVAATLFNEFAEHRRTARGNEEIGWLLVGHRSGTEIHVIGTIPAGTHRDASAVHVSFDSEAQTLASRIIRQVDRRLQIVGIVHTHPGSMRHPSEGDLQGDRQWIQQLQHAEAIFAIGTADGDASEPNGLHFSWYALGVDDDDYRAVEMDFAAGADAGSPLREIWDVVESRSGPLNRICRLYAAVRLGIINEDEATWLRATLALPWTGQQLYLLLSSTEARYYWENGQSFIAIDLQEADIEIAVLMILMELTRKQTEQSPSS